MAYERGRSQREILPGERRTSESGTECLLSLSITTLNCLVHSGAWCEFSKDLVSHTLSPNHILTSLLNFSGLKFIGFRSCPLDSHIYAMSFDWIWPKRRTAEDLD